MTLLETTQIVFYLVLLTLCTPLLGRMMAKVFSGQRTLLTPLLRPIEVSIYKLAGVQEQEETDWRGYLFALLVFNALGLLALFVMQVVQGILPLNPQGLGAPSLLLAFNTAVSFMSNTNWQSYAGEVTLSYFTQMVGLTVQNFVSAATGMAVVIALTRGIIRRSSETIGNFWVDLVRSVLYILLPLSFLLAVVLAGQGVVQTFDAYATVQTLTGETQTIALGPAASQVAIKQLGTNGGGFFNANSAHPLENPTPLSNFLQVFAILLIPAALTYTYGSMIGSTRQGWVIYGVMLALFVTGLVVMLVAELGQNPVLGMAGAIEGKETRLGVVNSLLWAEATTAASNGSVNAMHSSLAPLGGMMAMLNMMLGEVVFGGVGAGLYGMLIFVILTVFIAGLMVGRTPEYLGKKIEAREIQMATIAILLPSACILLFSMLAVSSEVGLASRLNPGAHGLSEVLYAFSSAAGNNGSAFAGLNANTNFYNFWLGIAMLIGRFGVIVPVLAIAGSLVRKRVSAPSPGTFPTDGPLFAALLAAVILIVGALTFFPVLALGPIVEHFLMRAGRVF